MKKLNFKGLVQDGSMFCIPACTESIFKYYFSDLNITQFQIMFDMLRNTQIQGAPSFKAIEHLSKSTNIYPYALFNISEKGATSFEHWKNLILDEIDTDSPVGIVTRHNNGPHIRIAYGYDLNKLFLFNPGKMALLGKNELLIKSDYEEYYFYEAEIDFNKTDSCKSIMEIKLK